MKKDSCPTCEGRGWWKMSESCEECFGTGWIIPWPIKKKMESLCTQLAAKDKRIKELEG